MSLELVETDEGGHYFLIEHLFSKVLILPDGCWQWMASKDRLGYGQFYIARRQWKAHRASYTLLVGNIPDGLTLDHLCRNRSCVNPAHLEAVTLKENVHRGIGVGGIHFRTTHCPKGHPYSPENTRIKQGKRRCRLCLNAGRRERRAHARINRDR